MTERERHDFTAAELRDLRVAHEGTRAALRACHAVLEQSICLQQRMCARIARILGESMEQPRAAPSAVPTEAEIEERGKLGSFRTAEIGRNK